MFTLRAFVLGALVGQKKGRRGKARRGRRTTIWFDPFGLPSQTQAARWVMDNAHKVAFVVAFVYLWGETDSLLAAALIAAAFTTLVVGGWLAWKQRTTGMSVADSLREMQRRRVLDAKWPKACEAAGFKRAPRLRTWRRPVKAIEGGFRATVNPGDAGLSFDMLAKNAPLFANVIRCLEVAVSPHPKYGTNTAIVDFYYTDPIGRVLPLKDLPESPKGTLAYGVRRDGSAATIQAQLSVLIGGLTRHGKSNCVWALLADAVRKGEPIDLYVSDAKGGIELKPLGVAVGQQFGPIRVRQYVTNAKDTVEMVERAEKAMRVRQRQQGSSQHKPSKEEPRVILLLDELLPLQAMLKKGTDSPLGRILFEGAASGYTVWANAQIGHATEIGAIRKLIPQRICFATPEPETTDTILGGHAESIGGKCSQIRTRGVGYSNADDSYRPLKFRAALVSEDEKKDIATGHVPSMVRKQQPKPVKDRPCAVYRYYSLGENGGLIAEYFGKAFDPVDRHNQHAAEARQDPEKAEWWNAVQRAMAVRTDACRIEWYKSEADALAAEERAIKSEGPRQNKQHNTRNPFRRVRQKVAA